VFPDGGGANDGFETMDGLGFDAWSGLTNQFGWFDATKAYFPWTRFPNVVRAQGAAQAADAFIAYGGSWTDAGTPGQHYADIHGIKEGNHVAPVDVASFDADHAIHTTASVAHDPLFTKDHEAGGHPAGQRDVGLFTPNIAAIVKELTDQMAWASGNAMGFHDDTDLTMPLGAQGMRPFSPASLVIVDAGEGYARPLGCIGWVYEDDWDASKVVPYPKQMVVGETVLCGVSVSHGQTLTWPADWHRIFQKTNGANVTLEIAWHKVDGLEADHFDMPASGSCYLTGNIFRVTGAADPDVTPPEASAGATGANANPDPDQIVPAGGNGRYLVLAMYGAHSHPEATAYPAGYALWTNTGTGVTSTGHGSALAMLEGAAFDPGTFTMDAADEWAAGTVVVYPAPTGAHDEAAWHMLIGH